MQRIGEDTVLAGRYTLTRKLTDRGGNALWMATDGTLDRDVTATVFDASGPYAEAALDSARRAAGVEDHHFPRVLDVGSEDGTAYVITESLHGAESMTALLQFGTLPPEEVRRLIGEASGGLAAASVRGLHHLHLTPHDIVRSPDGSVSVLGLPTDAALSGADDLGSEQASRADTLALVRIVYAGLTGRWPGEGDVADLPTVERRVDGELPLPSELASGVPGDLDTLCRTALGDDQGPRTPGELARQLSPWSAERVHSDGVRPAAGTRSVGSRPSESRLPAARPGSRGAGAGTTGASTGRPGGATDDTQRHTARSTADDTMVGAVPGLDADETAMIPKAAIASARERTAVRPRDDRRDYDPSFEELEPPVPLLQGHFEPDKQSSRMALLFVAVMVIVAIALAAIGLHGIGSSGKAATTPSASAPSSSRSSSSPSATPSPTATVITPTAISAYGTGGGDYPGYAQLAIDGNQSTYWRSYHYATSSFGGLKSGVGLLLNLGGDRTVGSVKITTTGGPSTIQVFVTDEKDTVQGQTPVATLTGSGTQTAQANGAKGQYIIVWVTQLSQQPNGEYREKINEIQVTS
ncbi:protein kinase family protein [Rudaeicoccus suwonensis]|uniref:Protein kinase domain-containing protein n=1 Tax=Rudaeicoccus suwonensis TaxID=657409 RepID=A0A561E3Z4_9MICO|nr:protein kinase family protein [Rudaeicoccus suwonensis]TWE10329.1 hypothetical protein BKA23_2685 [Rudaeicoccus suwonensis]